MRKRILVSALAFVCTIGFALPGFAQDDGEKWYAPFAFLMGKTWKADLPGGASAVGTWEWMYEGHFIDAEGMTKDAAGNVTGRNHTVMTWDPENNRPIFWFYLSDGSYSEGHMEMTKEAEGMTYWDITGKHLTPSGASYEWHGKWEINPAAGTVTIHQLAPDGEGGFKVAGTLNYRVID